jgi:hypothetical protein
VTEDAASLLTPDARPNLTWLRGHAADELAVLNTAREADED